MNFRFIVPRVAGDDAIFDNIFKKHLPNMYSEVLSVFDDEHNKYSIFAKYNKCIEQLLEKGISDDDVICFMHNDTAILDSEFVNKVEMIFKETTNVAIGVVGTRELKGHACWWDSVAHLLCGHIVQGSKEKMPMDGFDLIKGSVGYFDSPVCFDGLAMFVRARVFRDSSIRFRTDIFSGNHFYDLSFCLDLKMAGYEICIADILLYHMSQGSSNGSSDWTTERDKFVKHYTSLGLTFPIDSKSIEKWRYDKGIQINEPPTNDIEEFKL